jgi:hypothetical protein
MALAVLALACVASTACADEARGPSESKTKAAAAAPLRPTDAQAQERATRQRGFYSAIFMWCAILALGVVLLSITLFWGRRLRRNLRREPPRSSVPDPLWYLKASVRDQTGAGPARHQSGEEPDGSAGLSKP